MTTDKALRIGFAGTPLFAAEHLRALLEDTESKGASGKESAHCIVAVWTQPDRPAGRGKQTQASPVKQLAQEHHIPVLQPQKLYEADRAEMEALDLDLLVVVAYGLILPQSVLDTPRHGCINVHASLLPRWRGAAPIQRAVQAGDKETGVCIMKIDAGLDTGDVLNRTSFPISTMDTAGMVHDRLIEIGAPLLIGTINQIAAGSLLPEPQQNADTCSAAKIHKTEAEIDWTESATDLDLMVRAFNPVPIAYTTLGEERVRIWQAYPLTEGAAVEPGVIARASEEGIDIGCGSGLLRLKTLQLPGKKPIAVAELLRGNADRFKQGVKFESKRSGNSGS